MNFQEHEALDKAGALVTATVSTTDGSITGMNLIYEGAAGLVPVTVPTDSAKAVSSARHYQSSYNAIVPGNFNWFSLRVKFYLLS